MADFEGKARLVMNGIAYEGLRDALSVVMENRQATKSENEKRLKGLKAERDALSREGLDLRDQIQEVEAHVQELTTGIEKQQEINEQLTRLTDELRGKLMDSQSELTSLKTQESQLNTQTNQRRKLYAEYLGVRTHNTSDESIYVIFDNAVNKNQLSVRCKKTGSSAKVGLQVDVCDPPLPELERLINYQSRNQPTLAPLLTACRLFYFSGGAA